MCTRACINMWCYAASSCCTKHYRIGALRHQMRHFSFSHTFHRTSCHSHKGEAQRLAKAVISSPTCSAREGGRGRRRASWRCGGRAATGTSWRSRLWPSQRRGGQGGPPPIWLGRSWWRAGASPFGPPSKSASLSASPTSTSRFGVPFPPQSCFFPGFYAS